MIDPDADCFKQVQEVVKGMENEIDEREKRHWDATLKVYDDAVELRKHRIDAAKDMAVSYYQSKVKPLVTYNVLIRD